MVDLEKNEIGDLVVSDPPNTIVANKPSYGLITKKEYDKRWDTWYYAVDWVNDFRKINGLLKYREADIIAFKHYLQEWLDLNE